MKSIEQAKRIYELCVASAKASNTLTYGDVLDSLGYETGATGNAIRYGLASTWVACTDTQLPKLTAIVVKKATGKPSKGYPLDSWEKDKQSVFDHQEWPSVGEIDWNFIWANRKMISEKHDLPVYWNKKWERT
jgi:hypothetical protein